MLLTRSGKCTGTGTRAGCLPATLPPPERDSRVGDLRGTRRKLVPELTARGPLKIVLSGAARLRLAPQRGEGRVGRVSRQGGGTAPPRSPSLFAPGREGLGLCGTGIQEAALEGPPLKGADTVQAADGDPPTTWAISTLSPVNQILEGCIPGLSLSCWMVRAEGRTGPLFIPSLAGSLVIPALGEIHWLN